MENSINSISKINNLSENILESLPYFAYVADVQGQIIYTNKRGLYEIDSKVFKKFKNGYDIFNNYNIYLEDNRILKLNEYPLYKGLNNKEETRNLTLRYDIKGKNYYISMSCFPVKQEEKVIGAIVTLRDITEDYLDRVKIKNEREKFLELSTELKTKCDIIEILRNKEKEHLMHLKDVINNISEGIMVVDRNERITLCNTSVFNILGLKAIELVNKTKFLEKYEIIYIENREQEFKDLYKMCIKSKKAFKNIIFRLKDRESCEIKYIELNSAPIINKSGEIVNTILTIKDITETKLHQINAEEQAAFVRDVVNTVDVPIAVVDYPDITYRLTNKKYEEIMGYDNSTEKLKSDKNNMPKYVNEDLYKVLVNVGERCKPYTITPYKAKDYKGDERFYKIRFVPYKNKDNTTRIHIHGSDVTEEVNHNIELEKITRLKDEFFTIISHELRTPLTIIYSSLQLAYDIYTKEITPNMDKTLSRINQNCSRLLKLINNILDISKAEAGFLSLSNVDFDIVSLSETIVNSVNFYALSKGIELIFDTNEEECDVRLDKDKYEKILLNLLSNAIKYTPEDKKILVELKIEEENFYLIVMDYGVGIPKNKLDSIFDRFAQVNSSLSRRAEGTGIGLALVKKIVELMEGEIKVHSEVGKGSKFTVKFKKINAESHNINHYAILTENIGDRINIEFSDIN